MTSFRGSVGSVAEVMETFTDVTSTETFMETSAEASMDVYEDMKDCTKVTSTGSSTEDSK